MGQKESNIKGDNPKRNSIKKPPPILVNLKDDLAQKKNQWKSKSFKPEKGIKFNPKSNGKIANDLVGESWKSKSFKIRKKTPEKKRKKRTSPHSRIDSEVTCPYCKQILSNKITFLEMNDHLKECKEHNYFDNDSSEVSNNFQLAIDYKPASVNYVDNSGKEDMKIIKRKTLQKKEYEERIKAIQDLITKNKTNQVISINSIYKINKEDLYATFAFQSTSGKAIEEKVLFKYYIDQMIKKDYVKVLRDNTISITPNISIDDATLLGSILTKSLIDNLNFDVKISIQLVKQIFGFNLSLEEIKEIEPKLYSELSNLLKTKNYDGLSFIIKVTDEKGNQRIDELLFNGNDIKVTDNNINDYIQKRINYQLKNYNEAIIEIAQAFYEHFPKSLFVDFMPEELKTLFNSLG